MTSNATDIKLKLVSWILVKYDKQGLLGNEIWYGNKAKRTDIIFLLNNTVTAFEIKGENDNTLRLKDQLTQTKKVFDYSIIVTTKNHLDKVLKQTSKKEGILLYSNDSFTIIREPEQYRKHSKLDILNSMSAIYIKNHFHVKGSFSSTEIRILLSTRKLIEIQDCFRKFLKEKLGVRNEIFKSELGKIIHSEDLALLTQDYKDISGF